MDRNTDFSFMKSGFNNLIQPDTGPDPDMVLFIQSLVLSFTECALSKAAIYVEHSGRKCITPTDIKLALKCETFTFLDRNDLNVKMQKWKSFISDELDEDSESDYESYEENYGDVNFEEPKINKGEEFKKSECNCEVCEAFNNIDTKWENWIPNSPIEMALKKVLDNDL